MWLRGNPAELVRGWPSSTSTHPPPTHWALPEPDPHCQVPVTRKPPATFVAVPRAANTPETRLAGLASSSRVASSVRRPNASPVVAPMNVTQALAASPSATASMTWAAIDGGTSRPPALSLTYIR